VVHIHVQHTRVNCRRRHGQKPFTRNNPRIFEVYITCWNRKIHSGREKNFWCRSARFRLQIEMHTIFSKCEDQVLFQASMASHFVCSLIVIYNICHIIDILPFNQSIHIELFLKYYIILSLLKSTLCLNASWPTSMQLLYT
jgi:hypothetical protein